MKLTTAAERGEHRRADHDRRDERAEVRRRWRPVEGSPEEEQHDRLEREDDERRGEQRSHVRGRRQRRRAEALEDPVLAADHELDGETREGRVRAPVADEPREDGPLDGHVLVVPVVDGAEQDEEQQREEEDEEGRLPAAPEHELLGPQLVHEQPARRAASLGHADRLCAHSATSSAVSAR
jgi:hypothetical protein